jgi:hypothetical protein
MRFHDVSAVHQAFDADGDDPQHVHIHIGGTPEPAPLEPPGPAFEEDIAVDLDDGGAALRAADVGGYSALDRHHRNRLHNLNQMNRAKWQGRLA